MMGGQLIEATGLDNSITAAPGEGGGQAAISIPHPQPWACDGAASYKRRGRGRRGEVNELLFPAAVVPAHARMRISAARVVVRVK